MRRYLLGIFSIALVSACSDSSTEITNGPIATATLDQQEEFEDFSANFSSDGSKGTFISQRDDGLAHVYLYDASLPTSKLSRLDDKLLLTPGEGKEYLNAISPSGNWVAMSRVLIATGLNQLMVASFVGAGNAKLELPAGTSLNELTFAQGSDDYLAYVERSGTSRTTKVVQLSGDATAVTLTEIGSFPNQEKPQLLFLDGKLQLITLGTSDPLSQPVTLNVFVPGVSGFTPSPVAIPAQSSGVAARPFFASRAGLFTVEPLSPNRTRKQNGPAPSVGTPEGPTVAILETIKQTDLFQANLSYNWSAEPYLTQEPLTIAAVSGSLEGEYLLVSGLDVYACATSTLQVATQKLIRRSDSKVITFILGRKAAETAWTEVITNPCGILDNSIDGVARQYDSTAIRSEWVGMDGEFAVVAVESFVTGDREIRLARFKMNWDAGTVSDATILDVSANARPLLR